MRTASRSEALALGPAFPRGPMAVTVHSAYRGVLNLGLPPGTWPGLASLQVPGKPLSPNAAILGTDLDFLALGAVRGMEGCLDESRVVLSLPGLYLEVDCIRAERLGSRALPDLSRRPDGLEACLSALRPLLSLRDSPFAALAAPGGGDIADPWGLSSRASAFLGAAAGQGPKGLAEAVRALLGAGPGLTPSGDDFLLGGLAALKAAGLGAAATLVAASLREASGATTEVSAALLACAAQGHFGEGLLDLAEALSLGDRGTALAALRTLSTYGHSSGADLAAGFLFGLSRFAPATPTGTEGARRQHAL